MIETAISQETMNQVLQRLDALAAKLGVTAQYIYGVYVVQARVEAIRDTIFGSLFIMLALGAGFGGYRLIQWGRKTDNEEDWPFICGGIAESFSLLALLISLTHYYSALAAWLNPQFWALDALFKAIHG